MIENITWTAPQNCWDYYYTILLSIFIQIFDQFPGFVDEIVATRKNNDGTLFIWLGPKLCGYIANPGDIEVLILASLQYIENKVTVS